MPGLSRFVIAIVSTLLVAHGGNPAENSAKIYGKSRQVDSLIISPDGTRMEWVGMALETDTLLSLSGNSPPR